MTKCTHINSDGTHCTNDAILHFASNNRFACKQHASDLIKAPALDTDTQQTPRKRVRNQTRTNRSRSTNSTRTTHSTRRKRPN